MNKRGVIAEGIIPLIAFALSALSIFAFLTFNGDVGTQSKELSQISSDIEFSQQYVIEQAKLISKESINSNPNNETLKLAAENHEKIYYYDGSGNFYGKIRSGEFEFGQVEQGYKLNITGLFVKSEIGANMAARNFDICLLFDLTGKYKGNC